MLKVSCCDCWSLMAAIHKSFASCWSWGHLWSVVWTFVNPDVLEWECSFYMFLCNTWPTRGRFIIPLIYDHIGDSFEFGFTTWVQYLPRWKQTLFLKSPEVRTCFPKTKTLILLFDCIVPMVASCLHHSYVLSLWVMTVVIFHLRIFPSMSLGCRTFVELCGYMDEMMIRTA